MTKNDAKKVIRMMNEREVLTIKEIEEVIDMIDEPSTVPVDVPKTYPWPYPQYPSNIEYHRTTKGTEASE